MMKQRKAVALISGGLDSMLAARIVLDQGCHVEGLNFFTGFCVEGHTHAIRQREHNPRKRNNALWVAGELGIKLNFVDVVDEYKHVLIHPKHGYGANLNPCLDCKSFMVRKGYEWMLAHEFDFLITGEVIGQRPMSQRRGAMPVVARESGAGDRLVRPLCAKHLAPTLAEREGWIDRDKLYAFNGRSRKPQIALAANYDLRDYAQPAGGCCFLTDKQYCAKLRDLWQTRNSREYALDDIMLLKVGRHLRPRPHFKLIIGREQGENNFLEGYRSQFTHLRTISHPGPFALVDGEVNMDDLRLAAQLIARFSKGRLAKSVHVQIARRHQASCTVDVTPLTPSDIPNHWYL
ncbi:MAG: tRNA (5-methylaminomethyl-2-thiouridylate)-methyltransferase [Gammaproteobacteria bacterium]